MQCRLRIFTIFAYIHVYIEYFVDVVKRNQRFCEFLCNLKLAKAFVLWYHNATNNIWRFAKNI